MQIQRRLGKDADVRFLGLVMGIFQPTFGQIFPSSLPCPSSIDKCQPRTMKYSARTRP